MMLPHLMTCGWRGCRLLIPVCCGGDGAVCVAAVVVAVSVWTLGTFVSLVAVWRLSAGRVLKSPVLLAMVAGSLVLEPVRETLGFGQVNLMLCAFVLYDLLGPAGAPGARGWVGLAAGGSSRRWCSLGCWSSVGSGRRSRTRRPPSWARC
ncbi:glycosyltransferase family 87 protein [Kribbella sp. NPDC051620]|uniref:glycosyltransferase family 87 protein n=1 Tax=Kribbella sp. NPDC051620 TaxID=3364120 RepID=UPI0037BA386E